MTTTDLTTASDLIAKRRSRIRPEVVQALIEYARTEDPMVLPEDASIVEFRAAWSRIMDPMGAFRPDTAPELAMNRLARAGQGRLSQAEENRRRPVRTEGS